MDEAADGKASDLTATGGFRWESSNIRIAHPADVPLELLEVVPLSAPPSQRGRRPGAAAMGGQGQAAQVPAIPVPPLNLQAASLQRPGDPWVSASQRQPSPGRAGGTPRTPGSRQGTSRLGPMGSPPRTPGSRGTASGGHVDGGEAGRDGSASGRSSSRLRQRYGAWYVPPKEWKHVFAGAQGGEVGGGPEVDPAAAAAAAEAAHAVAAREAEVAFELSASYTARAYKEHLKANGLRPPAVLERVPTPTEEQIRQHQMDIIRAERQRREAERAAGIDSGAAREGTELGSLAPTSARCTATSYASAGAVLAALTPRTTLDGRAGAPSSPWPALSIAPGGIAASPPQSAPGGARQPMPASAAAAAAIAAAMASTSTSRAASPALSFRPGALTARRSAKSLFAPSAFPDPDPEPAPRDEQPSHRSLGSEGDYENAYEQMHEAAAAAAAAAADAGRGPDPSTLTLSELLVQMRKNVDRIPDGVESADEFMGAALRERLAGMLRAQDAYLAHQARMKEYEERRAAFMSEPLAPGKRRGRAAQLLALGRASFHCSHSGMAASPFEPPKEAQPLPPPPPGLLLPLPSFDSHEGGDSNGGEQSHASHGALRSPKRVQLMFDAPTGRPPLNVSTDEAAAASPPSPWYDSPAGASATSPTRALARNRSSLRVRDRPAGPAPAQPARTSALASLLSDEPQKMVLPGEAGDLEEVVRMMGKLPKRDRSVVHTVQSVQARAGSPCQDSSSRCASPGRGGANAEWGLEAGAAAAAAAAGYTVTRHGMPMRPHSRAASPIASIAAGGGRAIWGAGVAAAVLGGFPAGAAAAALAGEAPYRASRSTLSMKLPGGYRPISPGGDDEMDPEMLCEPSCALPVVPLMAPPPDPRVGSPPATHGSPPAPAAPVLPAYGTTDAVGPYGVRQDEEVPLAVQVMLELLPELSLAYAGAAHSRRAPGDSAHQQQQAQGQGPRQQRHLPRLGTSPSRPAPGEAPGETSCIPSNRTAASQKLHPRRGSEGHGEDHAPAVPPLSLQPLRHTLPGAPPSHAAGRILSLGADDGLADRRRLPPESSLPSRPTGPAPTSRECGGAHSFSPEQLTRLTGRRAPGAGDGPALEAAGGAHGPSGHGGGGSGGHSSVRSLPLPPAVAAALRGSPATGRNGSGGSKRSVGRDGGPAAAAAALVPGSFFVPQSADAGLGLLLNPSLARACMASPSHSFVSRNRTPRAPTASTAAPFSPISPDPAASLTWSAPTSPTASRLHLTTSFHSASGHPTRRSTHHDRPHDSAGHTQRSSPPGSPGAAASSSGWQSRPMQHHHSHHLQDRPADPEEVPGSQAARRRKEEAIQEAAALSRSRSRLGRRGGSPGGSTDQGGGHTLQHMLGVEVPPPMLRAR